ncbi:hypothetical protein MTP99_008261 [Tenebrio molitor]|nr:hypothetical protein MTP99_008261 [Tenebrio molitor]
MTSSIDIKRWQLPSRDTPLQRTSDLQEPSTRYLGVFRFSDIHPSKCLHQVTHLTRIENRNGHFQERYSFRTMNSNTITKLLFKYPPHILQIVYKPI